jgi:phthalate 4,5-dioxygenase oxygenase subunit
MLSQADNFRLTRVSKGTPMGELMRRYWQPVLLSSELPEPDGAPVRCRVLGEDLIAFRDTSGRVGLVDAYCPHRRAPLFFGRNEECGLRCVYHGWKFDADGKCVDLPSEPADSKMKEHILITAYPTYEKADIVWAYLGPQDQKPDYPDYEWMRAPKTHRHITKTFEACNWLQALEGGLDTAHSSFLHQEKLWPGAELRRRDGAPRLDVEKTDFGYTYISHRKSGEDGTYVRVYNYVMPWQQQRGGVTKNKERWEYPTLDGHIWMPIDDEKTWTWNFTWAIDHNHPLPREEMLKIDTTNGRGPDDLIDGFYPKRNMANDYLIDRQRQKTVSFTGITGLNTQDFALQEGMAGDGTGPIPDRTKEHLGSSDKAIIAMRNLLLEATRDVEQSRRPKGSDPARHHDVRPFDTLVPPGADWRQEMAYDLKTKW